MINDVGLLQKIVRIYTFNSPIHRGKIRFSNVALRLSRPLPAEILTITTDGRKFIINTSNDSYKYVYFVGEYEAAITRLLMAIIDPGNICIDVGANIGWYTTLFNKMVGVDGEVHSFEPVPPIFEHQERNAELNQGPATIRLNNFALGDSQQNVDLHVFRGIPNGHASISTFNYDDFETFPCRMTTLDSYLSENRIGNVDLVKIDIEGSELMMLKGASKLFGQSRLPVLEIEMALDTTRGFDYHPNDLIDFIRGKADYRFFAIDERYFLLREIRGFEPKEIGANVLCLPIDFDLRRVSKWLP